MFCYQCQETLKGEGCIVHGVCGKSPEVANLQDLLIYVLKGIAVYGVRAKALGIEDPAIGTFIAEALFSTITNVDFDPERFAEWIHEALDLRQELRERFLSAYEEEHGRPFGESLPEMATWVPEDGDLEDLVEKGQDVGVMANPDLDEDVRSLRELLIYGLKGMAAYYDHAQILGYESEEVRDFLQEALAATTDDTATVDDLFGMVVKAGEVGVQAMALLDEANTATYGHSARAGRRPVQRLLFTGGHRPEAGRGPGNGRHQRVTHRVRHRLVRAESRHRATGLAISGCQAHSVGAHVAGLPVTEHGRCACG